MAADQRILKVRRVEPNPLHPLDGRRHLPAVFGGRGLDVAFDTYDADTGELVSRGQTEREEFGLPPASEMP